MTQFRTHSEIADIFTRAERRPMGERDKFLRQLRHLEAIGVLEPHDVPRDRRGTSQFSRLETLLSRILIAAVDNNNMTRGDLDWLRSTVLLGRTAVYPPHGTYEINLTANCDRIAHGENWQLQLISTRAFRDIADDIDRTQTASWVRVLPDGRRLYDDLYPDPLLPGQKIGDLIETVTFIHVTNLLRPLLPLV